MVYESLRRAIMSVEIPPGAGLEEGELCRQFKVSRTPVREALIRLASEGLAELQPNRGARVAVLEFADLVDHYEAMDIFQPVTCHFAAVRRTPRDLEQIKALAAGFSAAVAQKNHEAMIRCNHDLHAAIAAASHNRSLARGYRQMLADKLRLAQHGLSGTLHDKGKALADRFARTARISERLVGAIEKGDGPLAERIARELNDYIRTQVIAIFSASLAGRIKFPRPSARTGPPGTSPRKNV